MMKSIDNMLCSIFDFLGSYWPRITFIEFMICIALVGIVAAIFVPVVFPDKCEVNSSVSFKATGELNGCESFGSTCSDERVNYLKSIIAEAEELKELHCPKKELPTYELAR